MAGLFDGLKDADATRRLPDMLPGSGVVRITEIKMVNAQVGQDLYVIGEGEIVEHATQAPGTPVKIFMVNLRGKYPKASLGDLRLFLEAVKGGPMESDSEGEQAIARNTFAGRTIRVQAETGTAKTSGKPFTRYLYSPTGGQAVAPTVKAPAAIPPGWFVDPHGRGYYNAAGEIKAGF